MHSKFQLGKLPKKHDSRNLMFANYVMESLLPVIPDKVSYSDGIIKWGMMMNDKIGDCTIASVGHLIEAWTKGKTVVPDAVIQKIYSKISGYDPKTGENDNGCAELDVLKYWQKKGADGDKIGAFAEVNIKHVADIKAALYLFHGLYIGVRLPKSADDQFLANKPWTIVKNSPIKGGHAIILLDFDDTYYYAVTWGALVKIEHSWIHAYMDEAYAIISHDYFIGAKTMEGFDMAALTADLKIVQR